MHERDRIYLDVPYAEKDQAKALGARWDPHRRQWWAPPASPAGAFSRWVDPEPRVFGGPPIGVAGRPAPGALLEVLSDQSARCRRRAAGVLGGLPRRVGRLRRCGEAIVATLPAELLEAQRIGPIEWRRTKLMPEGYWANTCPYCRSTFGNFPLLEGLEDAYMEGVERHQLPGFWARLRQLSLQGRGG